jgi:hypothetical protein
MDALERSWLRRAPGIAAGSSMQAAISIFVWIVKKLKK